MDFYQIKERSAKNGLLEIYPDFKVCRSKDLMVRGKSFYAIWDEEKGLWSTDEYEVERLIDEDLYKYKENLKGKYDGAITVKYLSEFSSNTWVQFRNYILHLSDNSHQLDENLTFLSDTVRKEDYVSKRLPYDLKDGPCKAYDEIIGTLYEPEERAKIEWAIGAVIAGDSKTIQKFLVFYGEYGTGKSTIINIIQKLFTGYFTTFEAKALTSSNNSFSTEVFKTNPLVAIQHDGDLSKIEDNTKLNSIISHEDMTMNEKYKPSYTSRVNAFLFVATNRPVKITDSKSGIIRRLIDVKPSGKRIEPKRYQALYSQVDFELGEIASHCLKVYRSMGKNYYASYRPINMMLQTDVFFNFVESSYFTFKEQDGASLSQAYDMYKRYCEDSLVDFKLPRYKFREELKDYFKNFEPVARIDGKQVRSYYSGFLADKFEVKEPVKEDHQCSLVLDCTESIFDKECKDCPAQYASPEETPKMKWDLVTTTLKDIDTKKLHYVKVPENHIVIDFDLKDDSGNKSSIKNLEEASKWPPTYAEFSKGGNGIHLHYIYDGDPSELSSIYSDGIEIKVFRGGSSLRRKLSKCNNIPFAHIGSGLPLKGKKNMLNFQSVKDEQHLRNLINKALNKEIHPYTKPNIDFIKKILDEAYNSGQKYDVTELRPKILAFANNSSNNSKYCIKVVNQMKFQSEDIAKATQQDDARLVFFDVEVFPNLFLVNWKYEGSTECVRMINPSPAEVEGLFRFNLVGFNNRRYDNHILYARYLGFSNEELYELSQKIIDKSKNAFFRNAYNISYTDVYDFCSKKQSLKKWEIELGIHHQELGLPWDQPVPEDIWPKVAEYCDNDVISTEKVFEHCKADFEARKVLAKIAGGIPNDTTNMLTARLIFGDNRHPQNEFVYTDLSKDFPGYKYENGVSTYRDEETGEGGYVYAEPGYYVNVALLDVWSMHPNSANQLNIFGDRYTKRYYDLVLVRRAIKHHDFDSLDTLFDGAFAEFKNASDEELENLSAALKIAINSVYGLTSARFENEFRDPRNVDNIVAKRGALFMINLKHEIQDKGFTVAHIKTDSIKIPNATPDIINFVMEYGKKYGYTFEHEATYSKMCLVNNAVYIAKYDDKGIRNKGGKHANEWTATGKQFQVPYVFKKLFSKEPIVFSDLCEAKEVKTALYLDMNEKDPENHNYVFVGKVGNFCPIKPGCGGGLLVRQNGEKYDSATGAKGYRWLEAEMVKELGKEKDIDESYYVSLVDDARSALSEYCDVEQFTEGE